MFGDINIWLKKISYFLIFAAALQNLVPGRAYRKYVRLFTGLILAIMILSLFGNVCGSDKDVEELLFSGEVILAEPDRQQGEKDSGKSGKEEMGGDEIKVDPIRID